MAAILLACALMALTGLVRIVIGINAQVQRRVHRKWLAETMLMDARRFAAAQRRRQEGQP
jgi:hypothetical protein